MIGPLAYVGGKRRLAAKIAGLLPAHVTYVEPFAGGAQVFFAKPASRVEVLNDLDGEVVNFFRVCQHHGAELIRYLRFAVASRQLFGLYKREDPSQLTDIQRAGRFFYLQKNSFGGKIEGTGQNFHTCITKPTNYNLERIPKLLEATAKRLARVQLESQPYAQVLDRYDRATTVFYCDPPYVGLKLYKFNFTEGEFYELAKRLRAIQGKFVLSINDHPVSRDAFGAFQAIEVAVPYTVARGARTVKELIFANFELPSLENASEHLDSIAS